MTPIRFAIAGYGHHAQYRLLPSFAHCDSAKLVGLWRRNVEKGRRIAVDNNILAFDSLEDLCASPEVDAVFITSPDALHLPQAETAFQHGKAVLCEKPLTSTLEDAVTMLAAAEASGKLFGVAHHYRWAQSVQHMRERVAAGDIGKPLTAHAEFNYAAQFSPREWITDPELAAGGPIGDVGVHCIDTLRFILSADVTSVSTLATKDELSGAVEASASLQLEMTNNIVASVNVSARALYRTVIEIVGTEGVLVTENGMTVDFPVDVSLRRKGQHIETRTFNNGNAYTRMIDNFARTMRGEEEFLGPGREGVENQRILDAAFRSWKGGSREIVRINHTGKYSPSFSSPMQ